MNSLSFSYPNLANPDPIEGHLNNVIEINAVKYDADQEITNTY
jgi:hypothetical protein